jgi:hypothetical protein
MHILSHCQQYKDTLVFDCSYIQILHSFLTQKTMCYHQKEKCMNVIYDGSTWCSLWGTHLIFMYKLGHVNSITSIKAAMETQQYVCTAVLNVTVKSNIMVLLCQQQRCNLLLYPFKLPSTFVWFSPNFDFLGFHKSFKHETSRNICWYMRTDGQTRQIRSFHDSSKHAWKLYQNYGANSGTKPLHYEQENKTHCNFLQNKLDIQQGCVTKLGVLNSLVLNDEDASVVECYAIYSSIARFIGTRGK